MKKLLLVTALILSFCFLSTLPCQANEIAWPEKYSGEYNSEGQLINIKINGMVCEFCAKSLEKVLLKRKEVSAISINLTTKDIILNMNPGQTIDDDTFKKLIKDAGNNAGDIIRQGDGNE